MVPVHIREGLLPNSPTEMAQKQTVMGMGMVINHSKKSLPEEAIPPHPAVQLSTSPVTLWISEWCVFRPLLEKMRYTDDQTYDARVDLPWWMHTVMDAPTRHLETPPLFERTTTHV